MPGPYDRITFRGRTLNRRTVAMILEAEKHLPHQLYILQGSYNAGGVTQSAGTHDGGGAIDTTTTNASQTVLQLRKIGFAAWYRPTLPGYWSAHIHAIAIGDQELSSGARSQVAAYYNRRNGLANNGPDNGPRLSPIPVFKYRSESEWASGDVYLSKLHRGVRNSDSVRRMKYVLRQRELDNGGSPQAHQNGNYGGEAVRMVMKWQRRVAKSGPNDGKRLTKTQAERLFGPKYRIHD